MPKLSLSRRYRRQTNLAQWNHQTDDLPADGLNRTTPRMVSEEDMHQSTSSSCSSSSGSEDESSNSVSKKGLKRPTPSICLVELTAETPRRRRSNDLTITTSTAPQEESWSSPQSPVPLPAQPASPCSPWGHFVDLVVQDEINSSSSSTFTEDNCSNSNTALLHHPPSPWFLPTCPPPVLRSVEIRRGDTIPYPIKLTKRRRLRESTSSMMTTATTTTSLAGLFLNVPDSHSSTTTYSSSYTNSLLDKARQQFDNLKVNEIE